MALLLHDARLGLYGAGFACKYDPAEAARKAILEAVHTRVSRRPRRSRRLVFQAVQAGLLARGLGASWCPRQVPRGMSDLLRHPGGIRSRSRHR